MTQTASAPTIHQADQPRNQHVSGASNGVLIDLLAVSKEFDLNGTINGGLWSSALNKIHLRNDVIYAIGNSDFL